MFRIGTTPSKIEGRSPHAHRHAAGRRLQKANVHPLIIKKVLHHAVLDSQQPYTAPNLAQVSKSLSQAEHMLESGDKISQEPGHLVCDELTRCLIDASDVHNSSVGIFGKLKGRR